jgi:hypothetical protein
MKTSKSPKPNRVSGSVQRLVRRFAAGERLCFAAAMLSDVLERSKRQRATHRACCFGSSLKKPVRLSHAQVELLTALLADESEFQPIEWATLTRSACVDLFNRIYVLVHEKLIA